MPPAASIATEALLTLGSPALGAWSKKNPWLVMPLSPDPLHPGAPLLPLPEPPDVDPAPLLPELLGDVVRLALPEVPPPLTEPELACVDPASPPPPLDPQAAETAERTQSRPVTRCA